MRTLHWILITAGIILISLGTSQYTFDNGYEKGYSEGYEDHKKEVYLKIHTDPVIFTCDKSIITRSPKDTLTFGQYVGLNGKIYELKEIK